MIWEDCSLCQGALPSYSGSRTRIKRVRAVRVRVMTKEMGEWVGDVTCVRVSGL
jgi:hypothetical protein